MWSNLAAVSTPMSNWMFVRLPLVSIIGESMYPLSLRSRHGVTIFERANHCNRKMKKWTHVVVVKEGVEVEGRALAGKIGKLFISNSFERDKTDV